MVEPGMLRVRHDLSAALGFTGNRECKRGARAIVRYRPETAAMILDDGATDGQPHSHPTTLGGVERVEQSVGGPGVQSDARVSHTQAHIVGAVPLRADDEVPRSIVNAAHRF